MIKNKVIIHNSKGIHCRPAGEIVKKATQFESDIFLSRREDENLVSAKKMMDILTLGLCQGEEVFIYAVGKDQQDALDTISCLIEENFLFDL